MPSAATTEGPRIPAGVTLQVQSWSGGCQLGVQIVVPTAASAWTMALIFGDPPGSANVWNARLTSLQSSMMILESESYNGAVSQGDVVSIGMNLWGRSDSCSSVISVAFNDQDLSVTAGPATASPPATTRPATTAATTAAASTTMPPTTARPAGAGVFCSEQQVFCVEWAPHGDGSSISFTINATTPGFVALGFADYPSTMSNADVAMCSVAGDAAVILVDRYNHGGRSSALDASQDLTLVDGSSVAGVTTCTFVRPLLATDADDRSVVPGPTNVIWSVGRSSADAPEFHNIGYGGMTIDFFATASTQAATTASTVSRPAPLWDGSFAAFVGNDAEFCSTQGFGRNSPYICAGGGATGSGGGCEAAACSSGQYAFSEDGGWTITTSKTLAGGGIPYRAFAYCPLCHGQQLSTCWPGSSVQTFAFSFKTAGLADWSAYVKLLFWTDAANILGLLPSGAVGASSLIRSASPRLILFPTSDYPNGWSSELAIQDDVWYRVEIAITPTASGQAIFDIAVNGASRGRSTLNVNVLGDTNGPQLGQYSFDFSGGSGSSAALALSLDGVCFGSAASCLHGGGGDPSTTTMAATAVPPVTTDAPDSTSAPASSTSAFVASSSTAGSTTGSTPTAGPACGATGRPVFTSEHRELYVNGQAFSMKGTNWFGFETDVYAPHGCWNFQSASACYENILGFVGDHGFNALRIPLSLYQIKVNPTMTGAPFVGGRSLDYLDQLVEAAADHGILIMLDIHRLTAASGITDLWYDPTGEYTTGDFACETMEQIKDIITILTDRYRLAWNVFAIDIKNEPHGTASWGDNNAATDWRLAATEMTNHVLASQVPWLIFIEGVGNGNVPGADTTHNAWWGGNMMGVDSNPIQPNVTQSKVVYSPHSYGPSVHRQPYHPPHVAVGEGASAFPGNLRAIWETHFGFLVSEGQPSDAAVVLGEWGGHFTGDDALYQHEFADWLVEKRMHSNFYWCLNPNSGDTGGLLADDWITPVTGKLDLLDRIVPEPTLFDADGCVANPGASQPTRGSTFATTSAAPTPSAPPTPSVSPTTTSPTATPPPVSPSDGTVVPSTERFWGEGCQLNLDIVFSRQVSTWVLDLTFANPVSSADVWVAQRRSMSGTTVVVENAPYNGAQTAGATLNMGMNLGTSGQICDGIVSIALNGVEVWTSGSSEPTTTPAVSEPTTTPAGPQSSTSSPDSTTSAASETTRSGVRPQGNPYSTHPAWYVNPSYDVNLNRTMLASTDATTTCTLNRMRNVPSAFWIDVKRKAVISDANREDTNTAHGIMEDARRRGGALVTLIIYDLPNRDCHAMASNGEICCSYNLDGTCNYLDTADECASGLLEYQQTYIDPLATLFEEYSDVPLVLIIEPDSLPNLATNLYDQRCGNPATQAAYRLGVRYAVETFAARTDATIYIDGAHGGWLGWANNARDFASLIASLGVEQHIRGFATNVANYQPLGLRCPVADSAAIVEYCTASGAGRNDPCCTADPCGLGTQYNSAVHEVNYIAILDHVMSQVRQL